MTASAEEGLTIAVAKGRILREAIPLLAAVGIVAREDPLRTRKLILDANVPPGHAPVRLVLLRAQDVPTYLEYGAADAGIAGRDVLLEYPGRSGTNRSISALPDAAWWWPPARTTGCRRAALGQRTRGDQVRAHCPVPLRGLRRAGGDCQALRIDGARAPRWTRRSGGRPRRDGDTLRANGLRPVEHIADVSARLIVNKASMKMKANVVKELVAALRAQVESPR